MHTIPDGDGHLGEEPINDIRAGLGCRSVAGEGKKRKEKKNRKMKEELGLGFYPDLLVDHRRPQIHGSWICGSRG
jgi:hypothetical protein